MKDWWKSNEMLTNLFTSKHGKPHDKSADPRRLQLIFLVVCAENIVEHWGTVCDAPDDKMDQKRRPNH